jgi:UDP-N-acetylmuramoyl-L-alanyl-D-glutamate--2,6-diaminopimelate ligase
MQWAEIIDELTCVREEGPRLVDVYGVQYDSRRVEPGDVFVAMQGGTTDGNRYLAGAFSRGAMAVVTDSLQTFLEVRDSRRHTPVALVEHGRRALAEVSAAVFGHPERRLKLTAITGTNGKTTTAYLVEQLLEADGRKCLMVGTVETRMAGEVKPSAHTTPESRDVLALMAEAVKKGCTEAVMEFSSHALEQGRVWGLPVDVAVFTNLTQDHLDYHGSMDEYARAKALLFRGTGARPPRVAVINDDADYAGRMIDAYDGEEFVVRYGTTESANHRAETIAFGLGATRFRWVTPEKAVDVKSPLTGMVNVENLMAAMCAAMARGMALENVVRAAETLKPAPGRFEVVRGSASAGFTVVVDYAHTDDALRNLLAIARGFAGDSRVITMFGCGGDRDRTKRPKMGRVAAEKSDVVVVTSDNPRSEEPLKIIEDVLVGTREGTAEVIVEEDRRRAIALAIRMARPGDIVLLAGKGHEKTQTYADHTVAFDDVEEAAKVLGEVRS